MCANRLSSSTRTTLILGGARSGKSSYAQSLTEASAPTQIYVATGQALDDEMAARIARHVEDRGSSWTTIEEPLHIATAISRAGTGPCAILVDCLTLWLSNLMHEGMNVEEQTDELIEVLRNITAPVFLVSNEVGMGIVPENPLAREFRDAQGRLNKQVAAACDRVEFIAAGLPLRLKG